MAPRPWILVVGSDQSVYIWASEGFEGSRRVRERAVRAEAGVLRRERELGRERAERVREGAVRPAGVAEGHEEAPAREEPLSGALRLDRRELGQARGDRGGVAVRLGGSPARLDGGRIARRERAGFLGARARLGAIPRGRGE